MLSGLGFGSSLLPKPHVSLQNVVALCRRPIILVMQRTWLVYGGRGTVRLMWALGYELVSSYLHIRDFTLGAFSLVPPSHSHTHPLCLKLSCTLKFESEAMVPDATQSGCVPWLKNLGWGKLQLLHQAVSKPVTL